MTSRANRILVTVVVGILLALVTQAGAAPGPALTVDAGAERHPINPDIYGMNFPDPALAAELKLPVERFGGNSMSRYNWHSKTTNRASDYYFLNAGLGYEGGNELPLEDFVTRNRSTGTRSLITVPLLGYVTDPAKPGACGFKVSKYGKQADDADGCGNGKTTDGKDVTGNDPLETSIKIGPDFVRDEVKHLVSTFGPASSGGVSYYSLDNEPSLWNSTHRDVHPQHTTYDELTTRGIEYAAAVKAGDPTAKVFGPADWGYIAYLDSEGDIAEGDRNDREAHKGLELASWYLEQFKAYEQQHGVRLLDYLDEHFYPEAQDGVAINQTTQGDAKAQQLRFDSTRALWDPTYLDHSYIGKDMGEKMAIIPRLKGYVAAHYPGTKLALTEYNWGGLEAVNGVLVESDVLGIFGAEGLDLATIWTPPKATDAGANAFRLFLSYDGAGARFGDTSIRATTSERGKVAIYAAERASDHALTIVVINKTADDVEATISVKGGPSAKVADVWRYSSKAPKIVAAGSFPVDGGRIDAKLPAQSVSMLVLPGRGLENKEPATAVTPKGAPVRSSSSAATGGGRPVNTTLVAVAVLLLAVGAGGVLARTGLLRRWWPVLPFALGAVVLVVALTRGGVGGSGPNPASESAAVTITSPAAGGAVKSGSTYTGTAKLGPGQKLFILVYAPGVDQYYDVSEKNPVDVGADGKWSAVEYASGDKGDKFTIWAFVLPADRAAAFQSASKDNVKALPDGIVAKTSVEAQIG